MTCITLLTTITRWQAQLMQQMLIAHDLATRMINLGAKGTASYLEVGILMVSVRSHNKSSKRRARDLYWHEYFR
ncbi:hypothetical protein FNW02_12765 [Komarekiella sp. 'clone 1']|uniref:Uncharacterized protein n=1 Tax=Komarekiella delphini-convector SJRDD-AB1 TaxID=2593771 RepID=A0AA40VR02_9NOST|nr:hypothetical protein [Komarekiella delphini-convector]MBD6616679.1 hypothetical protein [Komarekiella delphini-convector SJRDD-AB1]